MKNVTITMNDVVMTKARIEAARQGKSLSRFVSELVEQRLGRTLTSKEAMGRFLAGPLMDLTDEHGNAPSRDKIYD